MCLDDFTHTRRDFLKLSAVLSAAGAMPLLSSLQARAAAEPDAPVRIGYLPITDATPLLVAHNNGLFEAEGIQAERPVLLRSWAQVIEAFISGQVNVIHLLSPMTVWARYGSKVPAKVVAWNHVGGSGLTVAVAATINSANASFAGSATANGTVAGTSQGQFFGANAATLAGIATFAGNSQYDTAFGGSKN